jgi:hypothetical protein
MPVKLELIGAAFITTLEAFSAADKGKLKPNNSKAKYFFMMVSNRLFKKGLITNRLFY